MRLPILRSLNFQASRKLFTLDESKSFKSSGNLVSHSANLKHSNSKSTWSQLIVLWKLENRNIKSSGHNARSALLYTWDFRERLIYDNYRFDIGRSRASRFITNVSTPEWDICISPILFFFYHFQSSKHESNGNSEIALGNNLSPFTYEVNRWDLWTRSLRGNAWPM